ncbi:MAG: hypothetical protein GY756_03975 [bacterium]|nr:hypothetical protein [bacterium]
MKKILTIFSLMLVASVGFGQTNIFPTTGNVGIGTTNPDGNLQIGQGTVNGMLFLGGGKGYPGIGCTRSDGGLIIGKNIYARYNDANDNFKALVGGYSDRGFAGMKFSQYGVVDIFTEPGVVSADNQANSDNNIRLRILGNGKVGIGTINPLAKFEIAESNDEWTAKISNSGGSGKGLFIQNASGDVSPSLLIKDNYGNSRFLVRSDGNIGIGNDNPQSTIDILGNCGAANDRNFRVRYADLNNSALGGTELSGIAHVNEHWTALYAKQGNSSSAAFFDGKVGIGTVTPSAVLDVNYSTNDMWTTKISNSGGSALGLFVKTGYGLDLSDNTSTIMQLTDYAGNVRMKVQSNGKVGIGTSTPTAILDVDRSVNGIWTTRIANGGGDALGLLVQSGYGQDWNTNTPTIMQLEDGNGNVKMKVQSNGKVGIGTTDPEYHLDVIGTIRAREIIVSTDGADFVFEDDYKLRSLNEVEKFIKKNKHLPEIAPAKDMQANGAELGTLNTKLLQKIEELTLYTIEQEKRLNSYKGEIET